MHYLRAIGNYGLINRMDFVLIKKRLRLLFWRIVAVISEPEKYGRLAALNCRTPYAIIPNNKSRLL